MKSGYRWIVHSTVQKHKIAGKSDEGEPIKLWPCGEELKKLDEVCRKCEKSVFLIEERLYLLYDSDNI